MFPGLHLGQVNHVLDIHGHLTGKEVRALDALVDHGDDSQNQQN